jgi:hypothetical protein
MVVVVFDDVAAAYQSHLKTHRAAFVFLADVAKVMGRISYQLSFKEMSLKQWRINFCS